MLLLVSARAIFGLISNDIGSQAEEFLSKLNPTTAANIRRVGQEFDAERDLRIQTALFREDLVWLNRGYSAKQMDLMVFLAVYTSIKAAKALRKELEETKEEGALKRLVSVKIYLKAAEFYLERNSPKLKDLPNHVFRFHY